MGTEWATAKEGHVVSRQDTERRRGRAASALHLPGLLTRCDNPEIASVNNLFKVRY